MYSRSRYLLGMIILSFCRADHVVAAIGICPSRPAAQSDTHEDLCLVEWQEFVDGRGSARRKCSFYIYIYINIHQL